MSDTGIRPKIKKRRVVRLREKTREIISSVDGELYADLLAKGNTPFYTEKDLVDVTDHLARLLRVVFIELGITREYFEAKHFQYSTQVLKVSPKKAGDDKGNMVKAMRKDKLTWRTFSEIMFNILGCIFSNLSIEFTDPKGIFRTIGSMNEPTFKRKSE